MQNMYQNPALNAPMGPDGLPIPVDPRASQEHFEDFYGETPSTLFFFWPQVLAKSLAGMFALCTLAICI